MADWGSLTQTNLDRFLGGVLEVSNDQVPYLYRGQIVSICFNREEAALTVDVASTEEAEGDIDQPSGWKERRNTHYVFLLSTFSVDTMTPEHLVATSWLYHQRVQMSRQESTTDADTVPAKVVAI